MVYKVNEGRPNCVDLIKSGQIDIIFNTPLGPRVVLRRRRHPQERHPARRAGGHHADRRRRHRAGDPGPARARRSTSSASRRSTPRRLTPRASRRPVLGVVTKPLYLALSGGGAHAAAHAGVLRALERAGMPVAGIAGRQRGRAGGRGLGGRRRPRPAGGAGRRGLHPGCGCAAGAAACSRARRLGRADRRVPARRRPSRGCGCRCVVLATDVDTGEAVVFREGNLRDAVRASCSFPGVFPPMVAGRPAALRRRRVRGRPGAAGARDGGGGGRGAGGRLQRRRRAGRRPTPSWPSRCAPASRCCAAAPAASWRAPTW